MIYNFVLGFIIFCAVSLAATAEPVLVSAATSLSDAFKEIAAEFERIHPGAKIDFVFGASASLVRQVERGAPIDLLAVADYALIREAQENTPSLFKNSRVFAKNKLVLIANSSDTRQIKNIGDLQNKNIKYIAIGNPNFVPAGRYASGFLKESGLMDVIKSRLIFTQDVRQTLEYVARSEVDVGFVYQTDANIINKRVKILFELPIKNEIEYGLATIVRKKSSKFVQDFVEFLCSEKGREVLQKYGFLTPLE